MTGIDFTGHANCRRRCMRQSDRGSEFEVHDVSDRHQISGLCWTYGDNRHVLRAEHE